MGDCEPLASPLALAVGRRNVKGLNDEKQQRLVMRTAILLVLLAAIGYTIYTNFFTEKTAVAVGSTAPDFVLTDLKGHEHRLSDYRGKGVF